MAAARAVFSRRMPRESVSSAIRVASPVVVVVDKPPMVPVTREHADLRLRASQAARQGVGSSARAAVPVPCLDELVRSVRWTRHQHTPRAVESTASGSGLTVFVPGEAAGASRGRPRERRGPLGLDSTYVAICRVPCLSRPVAGLCNPDGAALLRRRSFLVLPSQRVPPAWREGPSALCDAGRSAPAGKAGVAWLLPLPSGADEGCDAASQWPPGSVADALAAARRRGRDAADAIADGSVGEAHAAARLLALRMTWPLRWQDDANPTDSPLASAHGSGGARADDGSALEADAWSGGGSHWEDPLLWGPVSDALDTPAQALGMGGGGQASTSTASDTDVASGVPPGWWVVTVASTSGCGRWATVLASRGLQGPFVGPVGGDSDGVAAALHQLGLAPPGSPLGPAAPHPALAAVLTGQAAALRQSQVQAARSSWEGGTACTGAAARLWGRARRALESCSPHSVADELSVLEGTAVDWEAGTVSAPPRPEGGLSPAASGASLRHSADEKAAEEAAAAAAGHDGRTPEQVVRDGDAAPRLAVHCAAVTVWPKLVRAPEAGAGSRVVTSWQGPRTTASLPPLDMQLRAEARCGVTAPELGGLGQAAADVDAALADAHSWLMLRRVAELQRRSDADAPGGGSRR